MTLCHELCKNGLTNRVAIWVVDSGGPKEACIMWGAHWRNLANTNEPSMSGGDAAFLSNYFDCLLHIGATIPSLE